MPDFINSIEFKNILTNDEIDSMKIYVSYFPSFNYDIVCKDFTKS